MDYANTYFPNCTYPYYVVKTTSADVNGTIAGAVIGTIILIAIIIGIIFCCRVRQAA
jgi:hypothetical protein